MKRILVWLVVILFFAVLIALGLRSREPIAPKPQAPPLSLSLLGGGEFAFPQTRGKPMVLNFMASW